MSRDRRFNLAGVRSRSHPFVTPRFWVLIVVSLLEICCGSASHNIWVRLCDNNPGDGRLVQKTAGEVLIVYWCPDVLPHPGFTRMVWTNCPGESGRLGKIRLLLKLDVHLEIHSFEWDCDELVMFKSATYNLSFPSYVIFHPQRS